MALWNHLVPDLVELSVQEREVDKLPHSKYPTDDSEVSKNEEENDDGKNKKDRNRSSGLDPGEEAAGGGKNGLQNSKKGSREGVIPRYPTFERERINEVCTGTVFLTARCVSHVLVVTLWRLSQLCMILQDFTTCCN